MANERYLLNRLLDGIAGWLTYQQSCGAKTLYCEHFLYPPVHDIAKGREWTVRAQQQVKRRNQQQGAAKSIDFIFYRHETEAIYAGLVFLEIKYLRNSNSTIELRGLAEDMQKLASVAAEDIDSDDDIPDCGRPYKYLLIVGQDDSFNALTKVKSGQHPDIVKMLKSALNVDLPNSVYRSYVQTKLKKELHWHAVAFGERAWPKRFRKAK